jgi:hypothetical protein
MQRVIIAILVLLVVAVGVAFYIVRPKPVAVEPPRPKDFFKASAFLAPGAQAKLPTTVRVEVWVREDLLPLKSAQIDPDGDRGPKPDQALDILQWKDAGGTPGGYYFDLPWDGPESAQAEIVVHKGSNNKTSNVATTFYVNIPSLLPWPGGQ